MINRPTRFVCLLLFTGASLLAAQAEGLSFCDGWRFLRADEPQAAAVTFDDAGWEAVVLPHTARIEALPAGKSAPQWQGVCWYRKTFDLPREVGDPCVILRFDGAMNAAAIWVNGKLAGKFMGGYLPYVMDISSLANPRGKNVVAVRLDNRDNPLTGPKPLADLDFNLYGGLYRSAHLLIKERLHLTEPILADKVAGGGVFVTFPEVSKDAATIAIKTHVGNADRRQRAFSLKNTLLDAKGNSVATIETSETRLSSGSDGEFLQRLRIAKPHLWSPGSPYLYWLRTELMTDGKCIDSEATRVGIRRVQIRPDGFWINGEKMFLRGCNRHQEYPYIGNALSDAAQYRDARKIKEAGFDYVRLSHYPQSPAFLDACDELGIVVMNCLMGWQYFGKDPAFAELKYQESRQLIRRDRNHPSVILWEVSLNESDMPRSFIERTHSIAHEEYPGAQCYTCGWMPGYDVFIQARQHGGCRKVQDRPCVVSEYGDWEYYAQNAGLEQHRWKDLKPAERSSRQLRGDGEIRLLQQATNFQEAHNDNLKTRAFGDGIWVMFDYSRGYAEDIEASGVMDVCRLPKFTYWFFRSQRDAGELVAGAPAGPMVFLATRWTASSLLEVRVFSNCEEVALSLNDKPLERRRADANRMSTKLRHAPFTFRLEGFQAGTLRATGYIGGREVAQDERRTPGRAERLKLRFDLSGRAFAAGGADVVFCHGDVLDEAGTVVPNAAVPVVFGTVGEARLVGRNPILSEAGVATVLLQSDRAKPRCALYALCVITERGSTRILSAAASPDNKEAPGYTIRYTTDGTEPSAASPLYRGPVTDAPQLRAALLVDGRTVALAGSRIKPASVSDNAGRRR